MGAVYWRALWVSILTRTFGSPADAEVVPSKGENGLYFISWLFLLCQTQRRRYVVPDTQSVQQAAGVAKQPWEVGLAAPSMGAGWNPLTGIHFSGVILVRVTFPVSALARPSQPL